MRKAGLAAIATAIAVAIIVVIERPSVFVAARLLECLVLAALAGVLAALARGAIRNVLISICSVLVGLALIEGTVLLLAIDGPPGPPPPSHDAGLSRGRPLVGWGPKTPGVYRVYKTDANGRPIFDTHVTIDADLNRKTVPSQGAHPIAFFGDSWTYGDGVEDDGTLPQLFAHLEKGRIPVLNLAFAGWSPAQNLIALRKGLYARLLDAPRRFVLFTSPFHLERTACRGAYFASQAPRFVPDRDGVRYAGPCVSRNSPLVLLMKIVRRFAIYGRVAPFLAQPRRDDVTTYIKIVEAFVAQAKADYGIGTTVLFAPFDDQYLRGTGYTEAQIVDTWRRAGIDVLVDRLPKIDDPRLYQIPGDGHPTALSNEARAVAIDAHLREVDPAALAVATTH